MLRLFAIVFTAIIAVMILASCAGGEATEPVTQPSTAVTEQAKDAGGEATEPVTQTSTAVTEQAKDAGGEAASVDSEQIGKADNAEVRAALQDRSFRQFEPHVDGDPRRGVIVSFFGPLSLWAQYAEGRHALNEWEITAREYRIEKHGDTSEVTVYFEAPRSTQNLPTQCANCIDTAGISISIRDYADRGSADFKINDPNNVLPSPFPVFESWTEFREDEYVNGG